MKKKTSLVTGYFSLEQLDIDTIKNNFTIPDNLNLSNLIYKDDRRYNYGWYDLINFNLELTTLNIIEQDVLRSANALKKQDPESTTLTALIEQIKKIHNKNDILSEIFAKELIGILEQISIEIDDANEKEQQHLQTVIEKLQINIIYTQILNYCFKAHPKFIYFNNYIKVKPNIHLEKLAQRQEQNLIEDQYFDYGNLSLLKFIGLTARELSDLGKENIDKTENINDLNARKDKRRIKLNAASKKLTQALKDIWNPDSNKGEASSIKVTADGQSLKVMIIDDAPSEEIPTEIELDQRSEGFQWMISFFIVFASQAEGDYKNCILLLDEPATSLHALKQKEFIKTINQLAVNNQIIYTTHSPFMISQDELDSVRVVELTDRKIGTKVNNTIISSDNAALFPLQEALGYNLAQSMFTAKKNLLLEGITDLWYLQGINSLVENKLNEDIALLPVGGVTKITIYANILCNNELKTVAFIDSDNEANQVAQDAIIKYKLGNKNTLQAKTFCSYNIPAAATEDIIRATLIPIFESIYNKKIDERDKTSTEPIVNIFRKIQKDFSKEKLTKEFLHWAKEKSSSDLTTDEQTHCQNLINTINRRLK